METETEESEITTETKHHDFDPEAFIEVSYRFFTGHNKDDDYVRFILHSLQEFYKDGEITGERLLDIGSGPVAHQVFAASKWFKEIVLSDLLEDNLKVLRDWKRGRRTQEESIFKYMTDLKGHEDDWVIAQQTLARKVRAIVQFDIRDTELLAGTEAEGLVFDAINVTLVHLMATWSIEDCKKAILSYSRLLVPGGYLVVIEPLGETYYKVKDNRYPIVCIQREDMKALFRSCGYDIINWNELELFSFSRGDMTSMFAMVARKRKLC